MIKRMSSSFTCSNHKSSHDNFTQNVNVNQNDNFTQNVNVNQNDYSHRPVIIHLD